MRFIILLLIISMTGFGWAWRKPMRVPPMYRVPLWKDKTSFQIQCMTEKILNKDSLLIAYRFHFSEELMIRQFKVMDDRYFVTHNEEATGPLLDHQKNVFFVAGIDNAPCIIENMEIISFTHIIGVIWHKDKMCRMLVDLHQQEKGWRMTEIVQLHHGPCIRLNHHPDSDYIMIMFYSGHIHRYSQTPQTHLEFNTNTHILFTDMHSNIIVVGDSSPKVWLFRFDDDGGGFVCIASIDHSHLGVTRLRSCAVTPIKDNFDTARITYKVVTMDEDGRIFVWEIFLVENGSPPIRIECIYSQGVEAVSKKSSFEESRFSLGVSKRIWMKQLQPSSFRVYLHDAWTQKGDVTFLECFPPDISPIFHHTGKFIISVYDSWMEIWDMEFSYYLEQLQKKKNGLYADHFYTSCQWFCIKQTTPTLETTPPIDEMTKIYSEMHSFMTDTPSSENE